uniref:Thioredoxin domain-containing protein n=1 Tax=Desulfobacca acetoxidans TaxID=60893 RepID=A0A7C3V7L6_9BACT
MVRKGVFVTLFSLLLLAATLITTNCPADQPKVAQVVYITLSKACGCLLSVCQAGDVVVGNVFNGARQGLLKRIDYSTDKATAKDYIKKYRITRAPALLFLDAQGNLLWMKLGDLEEREIAAQLAQFGM